MWAECGGVKYVLKVSKIQVPIIDFRILELKIAIITEKTIKIGNN